MTEVPEPPAPQEVPDPTQADMQARLEFWFMFHEAGGSIGALDWIRLEPMDKAAVKRAGQMFRDLQRQTLLNGLREILGQKIEKVDPVQEAARAALRETR